MAEIVQRWRLVYRRGPGARDLAQREELEAWEEALAAADLPVATASGARARPRVAMPPPLPTGLTAERELIDLQLTVRLSARTVRERLTPVLPPDHELVDLFDVWTGAPALPAQVVATDYAVAVRSAAPFGAIQAAAAALMASPSIDRTRRRGERETRYDLRPYLLGLSVDRGRGALEASLHMRLGVHPEQGTARPGDVVAALAEALDHPLEIVSGVRTRIWTGDEALPAPERASGGR